MLDLITEYMDEFKKLYEYFAENKCLTRLDKAYILQRDEEHYYLIYPGRG